MASGASSQQPEGLNNDKTSGIEAILREKISALESKISANDQRYEQRFADSEKAVNAALQAADKAVSAALQSAKEAVNKAEAANDKHFDSVNEFRRTLGDQANGFLTKDSAVARFDGLNEKINEVNSRVLRLEGQDIGRAATIGTGIAIAGVVIALLILLRRSRVSQPPLTRD